MYKKSKIMREIRTLCNKGTRYSAALRQLKVNQQTIENWRNSRPMLEGYFLKVIDSVDERRTDAVEDTLFDRIIKSVASPAEIIFYLANRRPNRWKRQDNGMHFDQSQHYHFTRMSDEQLLNEIRKTESDLFGKIKGRIPEKA